MKKIGILIILLFIINGCSSVAKLTPQQEKEVQCEPLEKNYKDIIINEWKYRLYDPRSAQYDFSKPSKVMYNGKCEWYVEVDINAKNRFGGFVGTRKYEYVIYDEKATTVDDFSRGLKDAFLGR